MAARKLAPCDYAAISGSDRAFFERITFRPRMMVPTMNLDLSLQLFGDKMFAPDHRGAHIEATDLSSGGRGRHGARRFRREGLDGDKRKRQHAPRRNRRGIFDNSWYQVFLDGDPAAVRDKINLAVKSGCKAICITPDAPFISQGACSGPAKLAEVSRPAYQLECHRSDPQRRQRPRY